MPENQLPTDKVKEVVDLASRCFEAERSEGYESLGEQLEELEILANQHIESQTDCRALIAKLDSGSPLTPDELSTLKRALVGDAEYYLRYDDDFARCEGEVKRIVAEIGKLQAGEINTDGMMHLRVLCREAQGVIRSTAYYLEQKERLKRFEDASRNGIDPESGRILADVLRGL